MTCFRAGWRASARDDASGKRLSPISYEFSIRKPQRSQFTAHLNSTLAAKIKKSLIKWERLHNHKEKDAENHISLGICSRDFELWLEVVRVKSRNYNEMTTK